MARLKGCHWSASSDVTWTSTIGSRPALLFSTLRESLSTRSLTSDILRPPGPPSESCARSGRSRSRSGFGCGGEKWTPALNYVSEAGPASVEDFFLSAPIYCFNCFEDQGNPKLQANDSSYHGSLFTITNEQTNKTTGDDCPLIFFISRIEDFVLFSKALIETMACLLARVLISSHAQSRTQSV